MSSETSVVIIVGAPSVVEKEVVVRGALSVTGHNCGNWRDSSCSRDVSSNWRGCSSSSSGTRRQSICYVDTPSKVQVGSTLHA